MPDHAENQSQALDRAKALSELQQLLLDTPDVTEFLEELARHAAHALGPGLSCGITLDRDGGPLTVASSDDHACHLDEVQYSHHDGPCLTAMRTHTIITITDLATDYRWGAYQHAALDQGIHSVLSLPISAGPNVRGALNLYSTHTRAFTTSHRAQAEAFSTEASRALCLALHITNQAQLTHHLETAMASRSIIDQAIGIIMGQNRCTATHAFDLLRAASSHRNIKLRDVAHTIVTHINDTPPHPATRLRRDSSSLNPPPNVANATPIQPR